MRKFLFMLLVILLAIGYLPVNSFADMADTATLGGVDSSGNYHWRVNGTGTFLPGTTAQNDIGDSSHEIDELYAAGNLTFKSTLQAAGVGSSGPTTWPTTANTNPNVKSYSIAYANIYTHTISLKDGYAGQIFSVIAAPSSDTGTLTIDADRQTAWGSVTMDTVGDMLTLLYVNDTYGWVIIGYVGVTVNYT